MRAESFYIKKVKTKNCGAANPSNIKSIWHRLRCRDLQYSIYIKTENLIKAHLVNVSALLLSNLQLLSQYHLCRQKYLKQFTNFFVKHNKQVQITIYIQVLLLQ